MTIMTVLIGGGGQVAVAVEKENQLHSICIVLYTSKYKDSFDPHNNVGVGRNPNHSQSINKGTEKHKVRDLLMIT